MLLLLQYNPNACSPRHVYAYCTHRALNDCSIFRLAFERSLDFHRRNLRHAPIRLCFSCPPRLQVYISSLPHPHPLAHRTSIPFVIRSLCARERIYIRRRLRRRICDPLTNAKHYRNDTQSDETTPRRPFDILSFGPRAYSRK